MRFPLSSFTGITLAAVLLLAGCNRAESQKPVVGVVPKGANHVFWQTVHAGAIKASIEYGLQLEWNAPAMEADSSRQIAIVDSMVKRKLAGIAVAPVDRKALVSVVERAHAGGIPVAIFDSDIDTEKRLTFVSTDNREGGRMAARRLAERMYGKGEVAVIGFVPGSASTREREEGFAEEIANYKDIKIVQTVFGTGDRAKSIAVAENVLNSHPDLGGLFSDNESSSVGAIVALKARGNSRIYPVAFDANDQLIADLQDRRIDALILQDPFRMGYEAVKAIGMKLKGETPPARIDSGVYLVTRMNMEQPDIVTLLRPDLSRWMHARGATATPITK